MNAPLLDVTNSVYQVGQVWKYRTRPNEQQSLLTIAKVELMHNTTVAVHVQVTGLHMVPFHGGDEPKTTASHLPFAETAIDTSVTELVRENQVVTEDFEEGYAIWRDAFLESKAGVFDVSVAEVVKMIESTINNQ